MKQLYYTLAGIIILLIGWSILLIHVPPTEMIAYLGVENALLVAFLVSALGGVSTATSVNYYATVITLAAGGTNIFALGIVAGLGITIGDSLFYYLGTRGHEILTKKGAEWAKKVEVWVNKQHPVMIQVGAYVYTGITPLPNDVLTVGLGVAEYSYRRLLPALLLGNITLTILIAAFANQIGLIQTVFGV
jgi:membrane protein YqaA with SNARE-associated domain